MKLQEENLLQRSHCNLSCPLSHFQLLGPQWNPRGCVNLTYVMWNDDTSAYSRFSKEVAHLNVVAGDEEGCPADHDEEAARDVVSDDVVRDLPLDYYPGQWGKTHCYFSLSCKITDPLIRRFSNPLTWTPQRSSCPSPAAGSTARWGAVSGSPPVGSKLDWPRSL